MTDFDPIPNEHGCLLSLRIIPGDARCCQYRKSLSQSCRDCEAWMPENKHVEVKPVPKPTKQPKPPTPAITKPRCSVANCDRQAQHGTDGMCKRHHTMALNEAGLSADQPVQSGVVAVEALPEPFGKAINGEDAAVSFGVDAVILLALDEAFAAKKHDWLVELSGLKPGKAVMTAASMVQAIEGLEHP